MCDCAKLARSFVGMTSAGEYENVRGRYLQVRSSVGDEPGTSPAQTGDVWEQPFHPLLMMYGGSIYADSAAALFHCYLLYNTNTSIVLIIIVVAYLGHTSRSVSVAMLRACVGVVDRIVRMLLSDLSIQTRAETLSSQWKLQGGRGGVHTNSLLAKLPERVNACISNRVQTQPKLVKGSRGTDTFRPIDRGAMVLSVA